MTPRVEKMVFGTYTVYSLGTTKNLLAEQWVMKGGRTT